MALIDIKNLSFRYPNGAQALLDITFSVSRGEFLVLFGASGCGKTTLLKHLKPALTPHGERRGDILFNGHAIESLSDREQTERIGFVMQDPFSQLVTDRVWHEIAFTLENLSVPSASIRLRVAEMAEFFSMREWFSRPMSKLSGGQVQLVNLASVMAAQPDVLVLDEPTAQIDPIAAMEFLGALRRLNQEMGTTIILCEHRLEEALTICDRAIMLSHGRIAADEPTSLLAQTLDKRNDPGFLSMPTPVRIFSGIRDMLPKGTVCPTTIRDCTRLMERHFTDLHDPAANDTPKQNNKKAPSHLSARGVWFRYEKHSDDVFRELDIEIPRGCIYSVMGSNGAGKSTMLSILSGELTPYRGMVLNNGKRAKKQGRMFSDVFRLPQEPQTMFLYNTCREELLSLGDEEKASQVVELMELDFPLDAHPYDLSGGQAQRLAIAKALMLSPDVLLLDEPTKGMDGAFKKRFGELLQSLKASGVTIVIASHDTDFCAQYSDICALCFDKRITASSSTHEFFSQLNFYTTAANKISKNVFPNTITVDEVVEACRAQYTERTQ